MADEPMAAAYVSWGLWVAECPRDGCLGAEHFGHAPISGAVGGLTRAGFRCNRCGLVCRSVWPDNAEDIVRVLAQRPVVETRNWQLGETLDDLLTENALHGLMPDGLPPGPLALNGRLTGTGLMLAPAPAGAMLSIGGR